MIGWQSLPYDSLLNLRLETESVEPPEVVGTRRDRSHNRRIQMIASHVTSAAFTFHSPPDTRPLISSLPLGQGTSKEGTSSVENRDSERTIP